MNATSTRLRQGVRSTYELAWHAWPENVTLSRGLAADACEAWSLPQHAFTARMIMSELATNAVVHGGQGGKGHDVHSTIRLVGELIFDRWEAIEIAVWDPSPAMPTAGTVDYESEDGRGLFTVHMLADGWCGTRLWPGRPGKIVWARIRL